MRRRWFLAIALVPLVPVVPAFATHARPVIGIDVGEGADLTGFAWLTPHEVSEIETAALDQEMRTLILDHLRIIQAAHANALAFLDRSGPVILLPSGERLASPFASIADRYMQSMKAIVRELRVAP